MEFALFRKNTANNIDQHIDVRIHVRFRTEKNARNILTCHNLVGGEGGKESELQPFLCFPSYT